jgi:hypothetical protein
MQEIGKSIIILGIFVVVLGILLTFFEKLPFLGKVPGDILIKKENFVFYAPIGTSIIISIILTIILSFIFNAKR